MGVQHMYLLRSGINAYQYVHHADICLHKALWHDLFGNRQRSPVCGLHDSNAPSESIRFQQLLVEPRLVLRSSRSQQHRAAGRLRLDGCRASAGFLAVGRAESSWLRG